MERIKMDGALGSPDGPQVGSLRNEPDLMPCGLIRGERFVVGGLALLSPALSSQRREEREIRFGRFKGMDKIGWEEDGALQEPSRLVSTL